MDKIPGYEPGEAGSSPALPTVMNPVNRVDNMMNQEMLAQINAYFRQALEELGLHVERIHPGDFLDDAREMQDTCFMRRIHVEYHTTPPPNSWKHVAECLASMVKGRILGNQALFWSTVPLVRQDKNCLYTQLLMPGE